MTEPRVELDAPAVQLDESLADRQPQASPGDPAAVRLDSKKALKDALMVFGGDARPLVLHDDHDDVVLEGRADVDQARRRREFHRVVDEVTHHLLDPHRIDRRLREIGGDTYA